VVVRNGLHGLLDKLVALVLETLAVTVFSSVYTSAKVIVLRRRRWGSITIRRDNIVDAELLADLLNTKMQCISLKLFIGEVCHDHRGQTHETGSLVLLSITPTVALLAPLDTISRGVRSNWASATLDPIISADRCRRRRATLLLWAIFTSKPPTA
jgi:hypothetical protein